MSDVHDLILRIATQQAKVLGKYSYLEIGVQEGESFRAVLSVPAVRLAVGVDTWGNDYGGTNRGSPNHILARLGPDDLARVFFITADSHTILCRLHHKFGLILVDGDHSQDGALKDLNDCLPLLDDKGIILADDLDHPKHQYLRQVITDWARRNGLSMCSHGVGCGMAELIRQ